MYTQKSKKFKLNFAFRILHSVFYISHSALSSVPSAAKLPILLLIIGAGLSLFGYAEIPKDAKYLGIDACKMCHSDKYKAWTKTAHSKNFELLVNVGEEKNEKCLPCHSTGYSKESGFKDAESTPGLKGTTCEACHGPGSEHNGDPDKINKVFPATVCANCHKETNIHGEE